MTPFLSYLMVYIIQHGSDGLGHQLHGLFSCLILHNVGNYRFSGYDFIKKPFKFQHLSPIEEEQSKLYLSEVVQLFIQKYSGYKLISKLQIALEYNKSLPGIPPAWISFLNINYDLRKCHSVKIYWKLTTLWIFLYEVLRCFRYIYKVVKNHTLNGRDNCNRDLVYLDGFDEKCFNFFQAITKNSEPLQNRTGRESNIIIQFS